MIHTRALLAALVLLAAPAAGAQGLPQSLPDWLQPQSAQGPDDPPGFPGTPGGPQGPPGFPSAPEPVPIDGGLSLLALAGAGYAVHRLRGRRLP